MAEYESVLKFKNYLVDEIKFKRNNKFDQSTNDTIRVNFNIKRNKIIDENNMVIRLFVHIFEDA